MHQMLIAIIDTVANDIAGMVTLHKSDASAIRFFSDVAKHQDSQIGRHVEDYELVELAAIDENMDVQPARPDRKYRIILTGRQWAAAQLPPEAPL